MKKSLAAALAVLLVILGSTHGSAERSNEVAATPATEVRENAVSVQVSGLCCVSQTGIYTYTALVSGASGSVSYQWWHIFPGGVPQFLGTDPTQNLFVNPSWSGGVDVCVQAVANNGQDNDCMLVTYTGE